MINKKSVACVVVSAGASAGICCGAEAEQNDFYKDLTATLQARNYYFSRDYSDIVGNNKQSRTEEWAQGFILNVKSGYTPGVVGFGLDLFGKLGLKLDSGRGRANSGLLPVQSDGEPPNNYSRLGAAVKVQLSKTQLKFGELQPNVPVLAFSDIRLLPPSYQGVSVISNELTGLTLQAGHMKSNSLRNEGGDGKIIAMVAYVPQRNASSDGFNYVGIDYSFNANRTTVGAWYAQLEDIYDQRFFNVKHNVPVGEFVLGANLGYFDSHEDGRHLIGKVDNQAFYSLLSIKHGGQTVYAGYQAMYGKTGFPRVFYDISPLGNELPTYDFGSSQERSWQVRYDYDFATLGVPGLIAGVRYVVGDNVKTASDFEGKDKERDLDISYVIQSGPLKNVTMRVRNAEARSNYRTGIEENRLVLSYTWSLL